MNERSSAILIPLFLGLLILIVGIGKSPWPAAVVFLGILSYILADRYFKDTFHDENRNAILKLSQDVLKIKQAQDRLDIKNAFGSPK